MSSKLTWAFCLWVPVILLLSVLCNYQDYMSVRKKESKVIRMDLSTASGVNFLPSKL